MPTIHSVTHEITTEEDARKIILYATFGKSYVDQVQIVDTTLWYVGIFRAFLALTLGSIYAGVIGFFAYMIPERIDYISNGSLLAISIMIFIAGLFGMWIFTRGIYLMRTTLLLKDFTQYFSTKESIENFLLDFQEGEENNKISPENAVILFDKIQNNIRCFERMNKRLLSMFIKLKSAKILIAQEDRQSLQMFLKGESEWYLERVKIFQTFLKKTLEKQTLFLSAYTKNIQENNDSQSLLLASTRLSSHIENLEKVRVML